MPNLASVLVEDMVPYGRYSSTCSLADVTDARGDEGVDVDGAPTPASTFGVA